MCPDCTTSPLGVNTEKPYKSRYHGVKRNGKKYDEHRLVWEDANGPIPRGYVVHHVDEDPRNNSLDNLSMMTRADHARLHKTGKPMPHLWAACGTNRAYRRGCKCDLCRAANRDKQRRYRAKRRELTGRDR
jgi:hypothetical protein